MYNDRYSSTAPTYHGMSNQVNPNRNNSKNVSGFRSNLNSSHKKKAKQQLSPIANIHNLLTLYRSKQQTTTIMKSMTQNSFVTVSLFFSCWSFVSVEGMNLLRKDLQKNFFLPSSFQERKMAERNKDQFFEDGFM
jgi:hypothetical protein